MSLSPTLQFDKTFNPQTLKELNQINSKANSFQNQQDNYVLQSLTQNYQKQCYDSNRKTSINSRDKIRRRISSSGVSKRFPKDFFKLDNDEDIQNANPIAMAVPSKEGQNYSMLCTLKRINSSKQPNSQHTLIQKVFQQKKNCTNLRIRHKTLDPKQSKPEKEKQFPETPKFSCKGNKSLIRQRLYSNFQCQNFEKQTKQTNLQQSSKVFKGYNQKVSKNYSKKQKMHNHQNLMPLQPQVLAFNQMSQNSLQSSQKRQNKFENKLNLLKCQTIKPFAIKKNLAKSFLQKMGNNQKSDLVLIKKFTLPEKNQNKQNTGQTFGKIDLNADRKKKKTICVGGKKVNIQLNQNGDFKVKMFN